MFFLRLLALPLAYTEGYCSTERKIPLFGTVFLSVFENNDLTHPFPVFQLGLCVYRYQSMFMGTFNNFKLIQNLASYHESIPNSVVLLYDPVQTAAGQLTLRAFRLSDDFLELSKRCVGL